MSKKALLAGLKLSPGLCHWPYWHSFNKISTLKCPVFVLICVCLGSMTLLLVPFTQYWCVTWIIICTNFLHTNDLLLLITSYYTPNYAGLHRNSSSFNRSNLNILFISITLQLLDCILTFKFCSHLTIADLSVPYFYRYFSTSV